MPASPRLEPHVVGRAAELAVVHEALAGDARCVTLLGPGGIGKTRLAQEVAARWLSGRRDDLGPSGAWLCDLEGAADGAAIRDRVAYALGIAAGARDPARGDAHAELGVALAARGEALLVLDGAPSRAAAADVVSSLLEGAPEARLLVTTRERLGVAGERVIEIGPLELPSGGPASESAAVQLFVAAAARARPGYVLADDEAPFVVEIARELEGVPLALELAATRMGVMGARALLHRLRTHTESLAREGAPARHASLDAVVDASHALLSAWEADALGQCTVFRGGFSAEAAEAVVDLSRHAGAPSVLEVVRALRDRSLLRAWEPAELSGELRLGMYENIRAYAARRFAAPERESAETRHAAHFVASAEAWSRATGAEGASARRRMLLERDNLLAVVDRVLGRGAVTARTAEPALRALVVLGPALLEGGPAASYLGVVAPVLDATKDSGADPALSAEALALRGAVRRRRGEPREGARDLVRALAVARTLDAKALEARVTHELGLALAERGDAHAALEHLERAVGLARGEREPLEEARAMASLGEVLAASGRAPEAVPLLERALALVPVGDAAARARRLLGLAELDLGREDEARAHLEASAADCLASRDAAGAARAAAAIGLAEHAAGLASEARRRWSRAAEDLAGMGLATDAAEVELCLAALCREEGKSAEAYALLRGARDRLEGNVPLASRALAHLAGVDADVGRVGDARATLERARALAPGSPVAAAVAEVVGAQLDDTTPDTVAQLADRSVHVRLAQRCRVHARASAARRPPPRDDALVIGAGGTWLRPPGGERVSLDRRKPLSRMLERLATERCERPGSALAWDALLEAGWPGERVIASAGAHRVRVAVSTLRKLGLAPLLKTVDDGYVLDPAVVLERVDPG